MAKLCGAVAYRRQYGRGAAITPGTDSPETGSLFAFSAAKNRERNSNHIATSRDRRGRRVRHARARAGAAQGGMVHGRASRFTQSGFIADRLFPDEMAATVERFSRRRETGAGEGALGF